jgi:hypothetical protein
MGPNSVGALFTCGPIQPNQVDHRYTLSGPEWTDQLPSEILTWAHQVTAPLLDGVIAWA